MEIRPADEDDVGPIVALCTEALGWDPADPNEDFFRWKHFENPFGPSHILLAFDGPTLVATRAMMRWEFEQNGTTHRAVRAVDTATRSSHRGQGLFEKLTLQAVDELTADGVSFVFNTPNDQSRPGYLKMGWHEAGKTRLLLAPASPLRLPALRDVRAAAQKFSVADHELPGAAVASPRSASRLTTRISPAYLAWRFGNRTLGYDLLDVGPEHSAVVRRRRRGSATELVVGEASGPVPALLGSLRLLNRAARLANADYAVTTLDTFRLPYTGMSLPGPALASRPLASNQRLVVSDFQLTSGDVELF